MKRFTLALTCSLLAGACGSSTAPTPPPTEDPPKISCPASQTIQLTSGNAVAVTFPAPTFVNGKPPVTTSCTPPSGSTFNVGPTTVSCTATDALQRADTCSFAITVLAVPPPPKLVATRFFAFGDSITRGEDGSSLLAGSASRFYPRVILPDQQTYPGLLMQSLIARYTTQSPIVTNQGLPSEAVSDAGTLGRYLTFTSSGQYDGALIMEGSNDLYKARNGTGDPNSVMDVAIAGLRTMVLDAKSRNIRPFLATIPPMDPLGFRGMVYGHEYVAGFNDRIRQVAALENVPLVDVYQAFGGNLALLSADGVHPNPGGYQRIADTFFASIKVMLEVGGPAAAGVQTSSATVWPAPRSAAAARPKSASRTNK
jgi:lysophospholipase L1-like esterase